LTTVSSPDRRSTARAEENGLVTAQYLVNSRKTFEMPTFGYDQMLMSAFARFHESKVRPVLIGRWIEPRVIPREGPAMG